MTRNTVLKVLNPVLAILLINMILTGVLNKALSDEAFAILHKGGGIVFAFLSILHVILNWNWIKATFFRQQM